MYDALLLKMQKYPSLTQVFAHLRAASLAHHLPAFTAALDNGGTTPVAVGGGSAQTGGTQQQKGDRRQGQTCQTQ